MNAAHPAVPIPVTLAPSSLAARALAQAELADDRRGQLRLVLGALLLGAGVWGGFVARPEGEKNPVPRLVAAGGSVAGGLYLGLQGLGVRI